MFYDSVEFLKIAAQSLSIISSVKHLTSMMNSTPLGIVAWLWVSFSKTPTVVTPKPDEIAVSRKLVISLEMLISANGIKLLPVVLKYEVKLLALLVTVILVLRFLFSLKHSE